jgi:hypothetical protein
MRILAAVALSIGLATTASAAPGVTLTMKDGRVWLVARDATVGQILDEWSRVGGTRVVNADRVPGRVTIELDGVAESQALDLLLRSAGGFVAKARPLAGAGAQSQFESVFIVAVSQPPAPRPAAAAAEPAYPAPQQPAVAVAPGVQRLIGPDGRPVPDDQEDAAARQQLRQVSPAGSMPPGFSAPPQTAPVQPAAVAPAQQPGQQTAPAPATSQTPGMSGGVPVPGMIVPAPASTTTPGSQRPPRQPAT